MLDFAHLDNHWLAVQVRSNWELQTAYILKDRGYEEFVPCYNQKRKWSDRVKTVRVPLFTGYVFCRFRADNHHAIISVPGVIRFVGQGNTPLPIDDAEIEALQITTRSTANFGPWPFLAAGHDVEVRNGPLRGLRGTVVRCKNTQRLIISVNLLQRSAFVEIDEHEVTPIGGPNTELGKNSASGSCRAPASCHFVRQKWQAAN
jgi:transcription antitermination factor NusG